LIDYISKLYFDYISKNNMSVANLSRMLSTSFKLSNAAFGRELQEGEFETLEALSTLGAITVACPRN